VPWFSFPARESIAAATDIKGLRQESATNQSRSTKEIQSTKWNRLYSCSSSSPLNSNPSSLWVVVISSTLCVHFKNYFSWENCLFGCLVVCLFYLTDSRNLKTTKWNWLYSCSSSSPLNSNPSSLWVVVISSTLCVHFKIHFSQKNCLFVCFNWRQKF
jgi:hypothetical protein